jgi:hypothetical protein
MGDGRWVEGSPSTLRGWVDVRWFKSEGLEKEVRGERGESKEGTGVERWWDERGDESEEGMKWREEHTRIPLPLQIIIFLLQLCK